jgi:hypothetical protein
VYHDFLATPSRNTTPRNLHSSKISVERCGNTENGTSWRNNKTTPLLMVDFGTEKQFCQTEIFILANELFMPRVLFMYL